jgi:hypothetical protein
LDSEAAPRSIIQGRSSVIPANGEIMATAWGQQKIEIQSPSGGLHAVALKRGGIVPNAPAASTTRRSQGLISGGFSASVGAWLQMPLRR